jgi:transposase
VFTGVINEAGFIRHSKIYQGNEVDAQTLEDMIDRLERSSLDKKDKTIVIDAGIATEENLEFINSKGYKYVCVSRKRLKDYTIASTNKQVIKLTHRDKNEVKLSIFHPEGYDDTWMYVQSDAKRKKETSMDEKLCTRYEDDLQAIKDGISKKYGTKSINKVWKRIGRAVQKNKRVSAQYEVEVEEKEGIAIQMTWKKQPNDKIVDKTKGIYFIRTNHEHTSESQLWDIYNTIREVESTFRCLKSDLKIRPVHHQKDERIESHIYLTILAYQLINTIRHMLKEQNITHDWNNIMRIMNTQKIQSVILPTQTKNIHLRLPSKPIQEAKAIYDATNCTHTQEATKKYVVYH